MTQTDIVGYARTLTGHWQGAWHDSSGASGDTEAFIHFDLAARHVSLALSFQGNLLGSSVPSATYDIDLSTFSLVSSSWTVTSPQFGSMTLDGLFEATATSIPGHPEIARISFTASKLSARFDVAYTITYTSGRTVSGTMAWTNTGQRAVPASISNQGAPTPLDIETGSYAAGLISAAQVSKALGETFGTPKPNGGRLYYSGVIDTSNATSTADSGDLELNYTVYTGGNQTQTSAFWAQQLLGLPNIAGPWVAAFYYPTTGSLYVELPQQVLLIQITPLYPTGPPTATQQAAAQAGAIKIATAIAAALKVR